MNKLQTKTLTLGLTIGLVLGLILMTTIVFFFMPGSEHTSAASGHGMGEQTASNNSQSEPLYWVAPMDPNFKRDKPGKSPMGMDLVPVYADDQADDSLEMAKGTVKVDPVTVHNLGVKTVTVSATHPVSTLNTYGNVAFAEDKIVHIHPRVEGWIETLNVRAKGEYIEQGQPLYSLYSPELVNAQEELLIALSQDNQALIRAARSRLKTLNAPTSLIKDIEQNDAVQRTITFFAPQSGYVSELNIQAGFYVKPSTTMLAIASLDEVWVIADIFAQNAGKIKLGQSALITSDFLPGQALSSTLAFIYPTIDMRTRTAKARFVLSNEEQQLKPDMYVELSIDVRAVKSNGAGPIIAVPEQAIIRTGESDRVVLALGEGRFKSINVTLGRVFDDVVEVIEGIEEGDEIVVSAQFLLDSESSISSDFMRMALANDANDASDSENAMHMHDTTDTFTDTSEISAWTSATVNEVMVNERMVNLTHGPLDAFDMMGMTMNFMVADDIDIRQFETAAASNTKVHLEIIKTDSGMYQVKTAHFMDVNSDAETEQGNESSREHKQHGGMNDEKAKRATPSAPSLHGGHAS